MINDRVVKIASALRRNGIDQIFTPEVSRLVRRIWALVAQGKPVPVAQVERVAREEGITADTVRSVVDRICERNPAGEIVGAVGLSQNDSPHRLRLNGRLLSTWCALDSLFLPIMLEQAAEITSICPATQQIIRLRVTPEGIEAYEPSTAVVSIIIPDVNLSSLKVVEEIWMALCNNVHFFHTHEDGERWFAERSGNVAFLSVEEAFRLGRLALVNLINNR